ncbi:MAG: signal peptidase I [Clostridia bacterium]|nr:signal peptidase I [Clostridia bacterium]
MEDSLAEKLEAEELAEKKTEKKAERRKYRRRLLRVVKHVVGTLLVVAAVSVLIAVLMLPVLRIYGTSMAPTLSEDELVLSVKGNDFETGDVIAFYYNNKILVKRVIAQAGQWVNIDSEGTVYVDNVAIDEPYVDEKAFGECDIELPYQVPEGRVFVMGDHREVSVDSRNTAIGCVAEEQIVGRIVYTIWPFTSFGFVK